MIDTDKYEWDSKCRMVVINGELYQRGSNGDYHLSLHHEPVAQIVADAPLLLAEVIRLREGIRSILSDYDITELIRDVPEDERNFEQQALIRMKEVIE
jgi:hypothetical protein